MKRVSFRSGLLIAMRAKSTGTCGIMVTASHNHHEDNGIKIIDVNGKPLIGDWELIAEMLINSSDLIWSIKNLNQLTIRGFPTDTNLFGVQAIPDPHQRAQTLEDIEEEKYAEPVIQLPHVLIGMDTRGSSPD